MDRENNYTIKVIDLTDDTNVPTPNGENIQTLQPDVGFIYEIMAIHYNANAPAGDTSGTHEIQLAIWDGVTNINLCLCKSNHSDEVNIKGTYMVGTSLEIPSATGDQLLLITLNGMKASNAYPIRFIYGNDTDAAQAGTRTCLVTCKKVREAI